MPATRAKGKKQVKQAGMLNAKTSNKGKKQTAYEELVDKLKAKRKREGRLSPIYTTPKRARKPKESTSKSGQEEMETSVAFTEGDNIIDMQVTDDVQRKEFPSPSDEEDSQESESESEDEILEANCNENSSATRTGTVSADKSQPKSQLRQGRLHDNQPCEGQSLPDSSQLNPQGDFCNNNVMIQSMALMQKFMLKKGIIDAPINQQEFQELMATDVNNITQTDGVGVDTGVAASQPKTTQKTAQPVPKSILPKPKICTEGKNDPCTFGDTESEVTIYKCAVKQVNPNLDAQIEQFINDIHKSTNKNKKCGASSSSEEFMDTSDECDVANIAMINATDYVSDQYPDGKDDQQPGSSKDRNYSSQPKSAEDQADEVIKDAECSKARLFEVPGNNLNLLTNTP